MIELYPDQEEFIAEIRRLWPKHTRIVGYLPTGGGKTRCAARIIEGCVSRGLRVCFTVPRLALIGQTVQSFADLGILDVSVMQGATDYNPGASVTVASIDTLTRRKKMAFDLVIIDEAHKKRKTLLEWMNQHPNERYIGLTATPFMPWMGEYFTAMARGKSMAWMIEHGRLAPYDVYAPDVPDTSKCRVVMTESGPDFSENALAEIMGDAKIVGNVVENWLRNGENRQTIALAVNVSHANNIANEFERSGVSAEVITSHVKMEDREPIFSRFRQGATKILISVDCLTEGADFPECSCLINARPTKSLCRHIQGLGRVLRFLPGKKAIIFDHSGSTLQLGLPCEIEIPGLMTGNDGMSEAAPRPADEREKPKPKLCTKCNYLKPAGASACPMCGFKPRGGEGVESREEIGLKKIGKSEKPKFTRDDQQRFYSELLGWQAIELSRGKQVSDGRISNIYRDKFGVWPRSLARKAIDVSPETLQFIQYLRIKFAKSKARQ